MFHPIRRGRPASRRARSRQARPILEGLEGRQLLYATSGGNFYYGTRITYSFMPDGTSLGGTPSLMNQRMAAEGISTATWQLQFEKAAAVWEAVANIQLAQVGDDGSALDVAGAQQDDSRFGDIRIGGFSENNSGMLAFTFAPPPFNGGTLAGDILFNTDQPWQTNGSVYDLETVAIHEIGHALGMAHSSVTTADMYAWYTNTKQSATADDIAGIQSIYGPVGADPLSNNSFASAIDLTPLANSYGQVELGGQSIKNPSTQVDYWKITAPASTNGTLTVVMQAGNLSSLSPRVLVYDHNQSYLGQSSQPYSYGGNAIVSISGVTAGSTYYLRSQAASTDPSGTGAYALLVSFGGPGLLPLAPPNTYVAQQPDQGGGGMSDMTQLSGQVAKRDHDKPIKPDGGDKPLKVLVGDLVGSGDALWISPKLSHVAQVHPHGPAPQRPHIHRPAKP